MHKSYPTAVHLSGFGRKMSSKIIPILSKKGGLRAHYPGPPFF
jgi:hypothetical protein